MNLEKILGTVATVIGFGGIISIGLGATNQSIISGRTPLIGLPISKTIERYRSNPENLLIYLALAYFGIMSLR
tara:strand:+ start:520 stop:738 length:219 start_codon:yes stop_codon:yes gene_type:complete